MDWTGLQQYGRLSRPMFGIHDLVTTGASMQTLRCIFLHAVGLNTKKQSSPQNSHEAVQAWRSEHRKRWPRFQSQNSIWKKTSHLQWVNRFPWSCNIRSQRTSESSRPRYKESHDSIVQWSSKSNCTKFIEAFQATFHPDAHMISFDPVVLLSQVRRWFRCRSGSYHMISLLQFKRPPSMKW